MKNYCSAKTLLRVSKERLHTGRRYLQTIYLAKDSQNSTVNKIQLENSQKTWRDMYTEEYI